MKEWICQVRPGNPYGGRRLKHEDFFRPEKANQIVFEDGIRPKVFSPMSQTIILENDWFCAVKDYTYSKGIDGTQHHTSTKTAIHICLPWAVNGREVIFHSPQINPLTIR